MPIFKQARQKDKCKRAVQCRKKVAPFQAEAVPCPKRYSVNGAVNIYSLNILALYVLTNIHNYGKFLSFDMFLNAQIHFKSMLNTKIKRFGVVRRKRLRF